MEDHKERIKLNSIFPFKKIYQVIVDQSHNDRKKINPVVSFRRFSMMISGRALKTTIPLWLPNAIIFLILFLMVTLYFSWQIHGVNRSFFAHVQQHADMVSKIVRLNATGSLNARQSMEDVLQHLLGNTARFVSYLDMIEPFSEDELEAFSRESGLEGITIVKQNLPEPFDASPPTESLSSSTTAVHSSDSWRRQTQKLAGLNSAPLPDRPTLITKTSDALYTLIWRDNTFPGLIILGIRNDNLATATERLGLDNTLHTISTVPGITYITITPPEDGDIKPDKINAPAMIDHNGKAVAQSSQIVQGMRLTVGVDADYMKRFIQRLTLHFYLFVFFLVMAGLFLTLILYRYQKGALNRVQQYERALSSQREEASLGRSAAAIAHEIRNPLNSLSMGLQRLTLENACPSEAHLKLIRQMSEAVVRANGSVTGLLNYARPRIPDIKTIVPATLLGDILALYEPACRRFHIEVQTDIIYGGKMKSDGDLLGQVLENIIKNAVEAQPDGGYLHCRIDVQSKRTYGMGNVSESVRIQFKNGNCAVSPDKAQQILEPYFTTRTEGTGLGMAIASSIVKTLQGTIEIKVNESREISTEIYLIR